MLIDSIIAPKNATPGRTASFIFAWALVTRFWLRDPSNTLLVVCIVVSSACIASNHGLVSPSIVPQSLYFYLAVGILIVYWDKVTEIAKRALNIPE
jgi:hypothetical protein